MTFLARGLAGAGSVVVDIAITIVVDSVAGFDGWFDRTVADYASVGADRDPCFAGPLIIGCGRDIAGFSEAIIILRDLRFFVDLAIAIVVEAIANLRGGGGGGCTDDFLGINIAGKDASAATRLDASRAKAREIIRFAVAVVVESIADFDAWPCSPCADNCISYALIGAC